MAADPNSFDHFRAGEPMSGLRAKVDNSGFDHYRAGEPLRVLVPLLPTGPTWVPKIMFFMCMTWALALVGVIS